MSSEFKLHPQLAKDCFRIASLPLSELLLCNDANYPWFILVPRVAEISEVFQLDWQQQIQFLNESSMLSELLMQEFSGDKLNVAALGNVVPQLHIHHIVRFEDDKCWPKPIWGQFDALPYSVKEKQALIERIAVRVNAILSK